MNIWAASIFGFVNNAAVSMGVQCPSPCIQFFGGIYKHDFNQVFYSSLTVFVPMYISFAI